MRSRRISSHRSIIPSEDRGTHFEKPRLQRAFWGTAARSSNTTRASRPTMLKPSVVSCPTLEFITEKDARCTPPTLLAAIWQKRRRGPQRVVVTMAIRRRASPVSGCVQSPPVPVIVSIAQEPPAFGDRTPITQNGEVPGSVYHLEASYVLDKTGRKVSRSRR